MSEVWQEYDCPVMLADMDIHHPNLVWAGRAFDCSWCGGKHTAGVDVRVETFISNEYGIAYPDLPASEEMLKQILAEANHE